MKVYDTPKCHNCGRRAIAKDPWGDECAECWLKRNKKESGGKDENRRVRARN